MHRTGEQKKTDEGARRAMEGRLLRGSSFLESESKSDVHDALNRASLAAEEDHEAGQVAAVLGSMKDFEQEVLGMKKQDKGDKPSDTVDGSEASEKREDRSHSGIHVGECHCFRNGRTDLTLAFL